LLGLRLRVSGAGDIFFGRLITSLTEQGKHDAIKRYSHLPVLSNISH
jgi:hypothetical protein